MGLPRPRLLNPTEPSMPRLSLLPIALATWCGFSMSVRSELLAPYQPDADTVLLFHLDEFPGSSVAANQGTLGWNGIAVDTQTTSTAVGGWCPHVTAKMMAPSTGTATVQRVNGNSRWTITHKACPPPTS